MKVDRLFIHANIYNTPLKQFYNGFLAVRGQQIVRIGQGEAPDSIEAQHVIDCQGNFIVPGLIDCHMHIESAMLTPMAYAQQAVKHGVTTIISEPHEIANVFGVEGIRAMMAGGHGAPIDIYYGIPSCVPSTNDTLETAGGDIDVPQLLELVKEEDVKCLGEVMNTRSVLTEPDGKANRLIRAFHQAAPLLPLEGHVPRIVGDDLAQYLLSGVDSDHTEHTLEELKERWFNGFCVQLQDKTVKEDVIHYLMEQQLFENTCFVTDDVMPDEILESGILDHVLRKALSFGLPLDKAIYCCTQTPAQRMRLFDRGELRPGKLADFVLVDQKGTFQVLATYKKGRCVFDGETELDVDLKLECFPAHFFHSVHRNDLFESDFAIRTEREGFVGVRVAKVYPNRTQTEEIELKLEAKDGELMFENSDCAQLAVLERHGKNNNIGRGLITGITMKRGAIATTYSHDSHNLCVLGTNKADMASAANFVLQMNGGFAVVEDGQLIAAAALPIAGILTDKDCATFAGEIAAVTKAMVERGYTHDHPIMSFCTLALPVSPQLKVSDVGLIRVTEQELVPLEV